MAPHGRPKEPDGRHDTTMHLALRGGSLQGAGWASMAIPSVGHTEACTARGLWTTRSVLFVEILEQIAIRHAHRRTTCFQSFRLPAPSHAVQLTLPLQLPALFLV